MNRSWAGKRIVWCNVGQPYSITSSAAGIIFTFGDVMDIRLGAMFALFVRHLARLSSFSTALIGKLEQQRNWIERPRKMDVPLRFGWHISLAAAARCAFRLSRAASASGKGPALMGLGGGAQVQSIPRAPNRTYGAEDTR